MAPVSSVATMVAAYLPKSDGSTTKNSSNGYDSRSREPHKRNSSPKVVPPPPRNPAPSTFPAPTSAPPSAVSPPSAPYANNVTAPAPYHQSNGHNYQSQMGYQQNGPPLWNMPWSNAPYPSEHNVLRPGWWNQSFANRHHESWQHPGNTWRNKWQQQVTLITDLRSCRMAIQELLYEQEVALDVEGVGLSRHGRIALIQVCSSRGHVYLFDITTMGAGAFEAGPGGGCLRMLLENNSVCKVVFDGRNDCDALYHIFWVRVRNVYDLQVLHALKYSDSDDRYLKGFKECLSQSGVLNPREQAEANAIKDQGKLLFAPDYGGSYGVWEARPLCPALVDYAVADVRHMLSIKRSWANNQLDFLVRKLTEERVDNFICAKNYGGHSMSERDFPLAVPEFVS